MAMATDALRSARASLFVGDFAAYENIAGVLDWPPHADTLDPTRSRASYMTVLAVLMGHFAVLEWLVREWEALPTSLGDLAARYQEGLIRFATDHQGHGDWHAIRPGFAAEWLGLVPDSDPTVKASGNPTEIDG
jgi:hypothetical protein